MYLSATVSLIFFSTVPFSTYPLSPCSSPASRPVDSRRETDISHLISCCVSCSDKLELVPLERYFLEDANATRQYNSPTSPCLVYTSMWRSRTYQYTDSFERMLQCEEGQDIRAYCLHANQQHSCFNASFWIADQWYIFTCQQWLTKVHLWVSLPQGAEQGSLYAKEWLEESVLFTFCQSDLHIFLFLMSILTWIPVHF